MAQERLSAYAPLSGRFSGAGNWRLFLEIAHSSSFLLTCLLFFGWLFWSLFPTLEKQRSKNATAMTRARARPLLLAAAGVARDEIRARHRSLAGCSLLAGRCSLAAGRWPLVAGGRSLGVTLAPCRTIYAWTRAMLTSATLTLSVRHRSKLGTPARRPVGPPAQSVGARCFSFPGWLRPAAAAAAVVIVDAAGADAL